MSEEKTNERDTQDRKMRRPTKETDGVVKGVGDIPIQFSSINEGK